MITMNVSREQLDEFVADFIAKLPNITAEKAVVFGLEGDLGAGKTTFVQAVARALGVTEQITSPTFVIAQNYNTTHSVFKKLTHIDAYRLEDETKDTIGFGELVQEPGTLILVEWPQYVPGGLPEGARTIRLATVDETTRNITYA